MPRSAVPPRAIELLAILTLVWGTNWPLFPLAVREVSVWTFRAVGLGGAGILPIAVEGEESIRIAQDRLIYWRSVGAKASPTVERLLAQTAAKSA